MNPNDRRADDREIFQMLGEHKQALININETMSSLAECIKQCKIAELFADQKDIRRDMRLAIRIASVFTFIYGTAISFLLFGHTEIFHKWFEYMFH